MRLASFAVALLAPASVGAQEVMREQRPGSPWPAVTVRLFVDASPEEAAAVFTDYERHVAYIPSVKRSRISRVIGPAEVEVDYIVALPIVSDEHYTVRNRLARDSADGYRVDWTLVRATSTKGTVGHARFTSFVDPRTGKLGTRFEYHNFVTPGSRLASLGFIRNRALREMEATARAIASRIEHERQPSDAMRARVAAFRSALPSERPER